MINGRYSVRLVARNEGIQYVDDVDIYRFKVSRDGEVWTLYVPGSKEPDYEVHDLDDEEKERILPRVVHYLERTKYFAFLRSKYSVEIIYTRKI